MDINDIMTDGKVDGKQLNRKWAWYEGNIMGFFTELAEAINAHLDGSKPQETPITPERLEAAGFLHVYNARKSIYFWEKEELFYRHCVSVGDTAFPHIATMEALSELHKGLTGHPLTWVTPYEETGKELEAMGFVRHTGTFIKKTDNAELVVVLEKNCSFEIYLWKAPESFYFYGVKTTAQLRELLALLEGKNE